MNDTPAPKDRRSAGGDDRRKPQGAERRSGGAEERPEWQTRVARPIRDDEAKSPMIPDEITDQDLELGIRVQLKTLTAENAEMTARHLAMVSILHDQDPELAHLHALAAARRPHERGHRALVPRKAHVVKHTDLRPRLRQR